MRWGFGRVVVVRKGTRDAVVRQVLRKYQIHMAHLFTIVKFAKSPRESVSRSSYDSLPTDDSERVVLFWVARTEEKNHHF